MVGTDVKNLDPLHFAASPVVVLIDGTNAAAQKNSKRRCTRMRK